MVVKRITYAIDDKPIEVLTECDSVRIDREQDRFNLKMFSNKKGYEEVIYDHTFTKQKVRIFIMENGKTIDRVDFMCG